MSGYVVCVMEDDVILQTYNVRFMYLRAIQVFRGPSLQRSSSLQAGMCMSDRAAGDLSEPSYNRGASESSALGLTPGIGRCIRI